MSEYQTPNLVKRKIKEAIRKALLGFTDASDRVFISRSIPTEVEHAPVLLIYSTNEAITRFDQAPKSYKRVLNISIECIVDGNSDDDVDTKLEQLGQDVERLMEVDETLGNLVSSLELSGAGYQVEAGAESPTGSLVLTFNIEFYTFPDSSPNLPNFKGLDVDYKIGHHDEPADSVVDAEDTINV